MSDLKALNRGPSTKTRNKPKSTAKSDCATEVEVKVEEGSFDCATRRAKKRYEEKALGRFAQDDRFVVVSKNPRARETREQRNQQQEKPKGTVRSEGAPQRVISGVSRIRIR
jgi:hypothetical protein